MPAGCFTGAACHLALTISAGGQALVQTGRERLTTSAGLVYFQMSPTARAMLARARGHRLAVTVRARDVSDASASSSMKLVPFVTSGAGPHRSATAARTPLRVIGSRALRIPQRVGRDPRRLRRRRAVPDQDQDHRARQDDREHGLREGRRQRGPLPELQAHRRRPGDARAREGQPARRARHAQRRQRGRARVDRAVALQLTATGPRSARVGEHLAQQPRHLIELGGGRRSAAARSAARRRRGRPARAISPASSSRPGMKPRSSRSRSLGVEARVVVVLRPARAPRRSRRRGRRRRSAGASSSSQPLARGGRSSAATFSSTPSRSKISRLLAARSPRHRVAAERDPVQQRAPASYSGAATRSQTSTAPIGA